MIEEFGGDFIQWLRGFFYVAKTGSVSEAALEIGRNQPTVSLQIKSIEREFGIKLFDRSRGGMKLTPEGEFLLKKAIEIFETVKEVRNRFDSERDELKGLVKIVSTHALNRFYLPDFIVHFSEKYPGVHFHLKGGGLSDIINDVDSLDADFGIGYFHSFPERFVCQDLFETKLVLVVPKTGPYSKKRATNLEQSSELPFISYPPTSTLYPIVIARFYEKQLELNQVLILNNLETILEYVAIGIGVSIVYEYCVSSRVMDRIKVIPLDVFFDAVRVRILMRKRGYFSPPTKAFLKTLKPDIELL